MQGHMNAYLRAFYRCQSLTWRQAACFCSYGSHEGNFAESEAFVSHLRGRSRYREGWEEVTKGRRYYYRRRKMLLLSLFADGRNFVAMLKHEGKKGFCIRAWLVGVLDAWSIRARLDLNSYGF
ncbi:hypothetical protein B296_00024413 [Ensete ventricosum]|uniref:Uncharacterized protein n=1 Tax=Ensete ventricosum TaxID=4639 RepID=A0A426YKA1_ENSVE|nr:hypothetical protein B296_00024413 [Ensete ventricosum]